MDTDQEEMERNLVFDAILDLSHGDMRRAVTALQSAHTLTGMGAFGPIEVRWYPLDSYFFERRTDIAYFFFTFVFPHLLLESLRTLKRWQESLQTPSF